MPENTKNLVLEHLRHVRGTLDRIDQRLADLATRPGHVSFHWVDRLVHPGDAPLSVVHPGDAPLIEKVQNGSN
jgi:hypothetical protein